MCWFNSRCNTELIANTVQKQLLQLLIEQIDILGALLTASQYSVMQQKFKSLLKQQKLLGSKFPLVKGKIDYISFRLDY